MRIVIGAPVQSREWIIKDWMDHAAESAHQAGADPEFLLVVSEQDPTYEVAEKHAAKRGLPIEFIAFDEDDRPDRRVWNHERYHHMVELRNTLLRGVREKNPDYFLSLDTDILTNKMSLYYMFKLVRSYDGIGGKLYMTTSGTSHPSFAYLTPEGGLRRFESVEEMKVDVIMAMKLMNHAAYNVDYKWAKQGEDIGWSTSATEAGLKLGWSGIVPNKHVMNPSLFGEVDQRCGY